MSEQIPAKTLSKVRDSSLIVPSARDLKDLSRRRFLTATGATAGALALSSQSASAFFFFGGKTDLNTSDLPQQWVAEQGEELHAYARLIAKHRLEKVTVMQVIKAHARSKGSVWNCIPPRAHWKNMIPTLKAADQIAVALGTELSEVTSAYRCPQYNARCPGAKPRSYHMQNVALDLMFNTSQARVARVARELRNNGVFQGGVGRYSIFTHIDTRGYNADW